MRPTTGTGLINKYTHASGHIDLIDAHTHTSGPCRRINLTLTIHPSHMVEGALDDDDGFGHWQRVSG